MPIYGSCGFNVRTSCRAPCHLDHAPMMTLSTIISAYSCQPVTIPQLHCSRWSWQWQRFALCSLLIKIGSLCDTLRQISCSPDMSLLLWHGPRCWLTGNMSVSVNLSPACDGVWWLQTPDIVPRCCLDVTSWITGSQLTPYMRSPREAWALTIKCIHTQSGRLEPQGWDKE